MEHNSLKIYQDALIEYIVKNSKIIPFNIRELDIDSLSQLATQTYERVNNGVHIWNDNQPLCFEEFDNHIPHLD